MPRGTPTYITISPTGQVIANFSGVFAGNVVIPESVSPFANPPFQAGGAVEWDESGSHREFIQGTREGVAPTTHILTLGTEADARTSQNFAYIRALSNEPGSAAIGSSGIYLSAEDSVGGGFDNELLIDSANNSGMFLQSASDVQNNATGSLTNAGAYQYPPANGCSIQLPKTLQLPHVIYVGIRITLDVLSSSNAYAALTINSGGIYDLAGSVAPPGGVIIATGTAGPNPPITSYLLASDPHIQPPLTNFAVSGGGDFSGIANFPFSGGNTMMMAGGLIPIFIPLNAAYNSPILALEYQVDAGGTYNVINQALCVIY